MLLKKNYLLIYLLPFLFTSIACLSTETTKPAKTNSFFDLKSYFKRELLSLQKVKNVRKTIAFNGEREEQDVSNLDFSKELVLFNASDINNPLENTLRFSLSFDFGDIFEVN